MENKRVSYVVRIFYKTFTISGCVWVYVVGCDRTDVSFWGCQSLNLLTVAFNKDINLAKE